METDVFPLALEAHCFGAAERNRTSFKGSSIPRYDRISYSSIIGPRYSQTWNFVFQRVALRKFFGDAGRASDNVIQDKFGRFV